MKAKYCVCGCAIQYKRDLCFDCVKLYGTDKSQWPEWVAFLVKDNQDEWNRERYHDELEYYDETFDTKWAPPSLDPEKSDVVHDRVKLDVWFPVHNTNRKR